MCHLSKKDQYVCQINQGIAEAVTCLLGGAQFSSGPFYHPRSSRGRYGHPREAAVRAGNFPDSNGISDDFKRQNRSHETEPVPAPPGLALLPAPTRAAPQRLRATALRLPLVARGMVEVIRFHCACQLAVGFIGDGR